MITLIACIDFNWGLSYKGQPLIHLPSHWAHFDRLTKGHVCITDTDTLNYINHHPNTTLSNRISVILTNNKKEKVPQGVFVYHSVEDIIKAYKSFDKDTDVFIIGSKDIYKEFLPYADKIELTIVEHKFEYVDTYFPNLSLNDWKLETESHREKDYDCEHNFYYRSFSFKRIKNNTKSD